VRSKRIYLEKEGNVERKKGGVKIIIREERMLNE